LNFLQKYNRKYNKNFKKVSRDTMDLFMQYNWPGNVRELENMIKRVVVLGSEKPIITEFLLKEEDNVSQIKRVNGEEGSGEVDNVSPPLEDLSFIDSLLEGMDENYTLKEVSKKASGMAEKELIEKVLRENNWNRKKTSRILKVSYKALLYKIKENNIDKFARY